MTFFKGSRYESVGEVESTDAHGRSVRYKRTRFIADPPVRGVHVVTDDERLDRLASSAYGDVERWWLIADANAAIWPGDVLAESGRIIDMPAGEP
jgi:hypothetical protein